MADFMDTYREYIQLVPRARIFHVHQLSVKQEKKAEKLMRQFIEGKRTKPVTDEEVLGEPSEVQPSDLGKEPETRGSRIKT